MADSLLIAKVEWGTDDVKENEHNSLQGMLVSFIYTLYFIQPGLGSRSRLEKKSGAVAGKN